MADLGIIFLRRELTIHWYQSLFTIMYHYERKYAVPFFLGHPVYSFIVVGGIFPRPATIKKVYQSIEWFSHLAGLQWLIVLSMLIRGITIVSL